MGLPAIGLSAWVRQGALESGQMPAFGLHGTALQVTLQPNPDEVANGQFEDAVPSS